MRVAKAVFALAVPLVGKPTVSDQCAFEPVENADGIKRGLTAMRVRSQMRQSISAGDVNPSAIAIDPDAGFVRADDCRISDCRLDALVRNE